MSFTPEDRAHLTEWLRGHAGAVQFIDTLFDVAHTVDDLTDGDVAMETARIHDAFWKALIALPRNQFYVEHFSLLNGALQLAILNWHVANRLEVTEQPNGKEIAFVLRSSYMDLVTLCAWIIGGMEWAVQVGSEMRMYAAREGFPAYLVNLKQERRAALIGG